ncbi:MAG TPA: hypothetical protein VK926_03220 [Gaiellaceae bacterium]|nr:hypothetical protein [Gaiellaceae bacterium]
MSDGSGVAWGSVAAGLGSVATLPLAVYLTRFSDTYELLHAGLAIPVGAALGIVSVVLAGRARRRNAVLLGRGGRRGVRRVGRTLGVAGLCLAAAGVVALGVYGLLEYVGSRS